MNRNSFRFNNSTWVSAGITAQTGWCKRSNPERPLWGSIFHTCRKGGLEKEEGWEDGPAPQPDQAWGLQWGMVIRCLFSQTFCSHLEKSLKQETQV